MKTKPFNDLMEKVLTHEEITQIREEAKKEYEQFKSMAKKAAKLPDFSTEELGIRIKQLGK